MPSTALVHALWRGRRNKIASAFVRAYGIKRTSEIVPIRPRKRQFTKKRKQQQRSLPQQQQQQPPQILALVPDFLAAQPPQQQTNSSALQTNTSALSLIDAAFDAFSDAVRAWPSPTAHFFVQDPLPSFADAFAELDDWAAAAVSSPP